MAFNPTTPELWLEVKAAIQETEQQTDASSDIVRRMTGRFYRKDNKEIEADPENWGYAFMSNILPALGIRNPNVKVKPARVIGHRIVGQAMQDGLNAWVDDIAFAEVHNPVNVDFLWSRGVVLHYLAEDQRFSRGVVTPSIKRIDPRHFFQDSLADAPDTDEFRGHWYYADVDDLVNDDQLTEEAKLYVAGFAGAGDEDVTGNSKQPFRKRSGSELGRRRVKCYSVWLRERNTLRVLCESAQGMELYPERPFYGARTGPYQLYDAYPVPGQAWPLPPMVAVEDQVRDLNIHARAMGRAAARRKSIGLVEAANPDLGDKLTNAEDGEIVPVKGITGQYVMLEFPGATKEQYTYTEYARNRLDRVSGLTATIQGNVGQADTATEAKIADDALSNRVRFLKYRIRYGQECLVKSIGWYLFHTEGIIIPVNRRDSYSGELMEGLFFGGPSPTTDGGATWDDFAIQVTLADENQIAEQTRVMGFYQVFFQIAQAAPMMPWVRWMSVLRDLAEPWGMEDKVDEWMIPEYFGAFSQPPQMPPSMVMGGQPTAPQWSMLPGHRKGPEFQLGNGGIPAAGPGNGSINVQGRTTGPSQPGPTPQRPGMANAA